MDIAPQILNARVMHKRLFPRENQFTYRVYYLALPVASLDSATISEVLPFNRFGKLSFYNRDHGTRDGASLGTWIGDILSEQGIKDQISDVMLICMPRVLGYVFNPVSFWLCMDSNRQLRAVLCEVCNTFGETHSYLCRRDDGGVINDQDWLDTQKMFHVSPFLPREGSYHFRFSIQDNALGIWIDYYDVHNKKQLITALTGTLEPLTKASLSAAFWRHPLVTLKTIALIHWQALKLFTKGIKYMVKPKQYDVRLSTTRSK